MSYIIISNLSIQQKINHSFNYNIITFIISLITTVFTAMKGFEFLLLGIGAICGAFLRYKIVESPLVVLGGLPLNVLIVNIIGSFILGIFSVLSFSWNLDPKYFFFFAIGFCGSLTTMSSFALEVNNLVDNKQFVLGIINIFANVGLSILSVLGGRILASIFV